MIDIPSLTAGMARNLAKALLDGPPASNMACTLHIKKRANIDTALPLSVLFWSLHSCLTSHSVGAQSAAC